MLWGRPGSYEANGISIMPPLNREQLTNLLGELVLDEHRFRSVSALQRSEVDFEDAYPWRSPVDCHLHATLMSFSWKLR